jgi:hypothetical protein
MLPINRRWIDGGRHIIHRAFCKIDGQLSWVIPGACEKYNLRMRRTHHHQAGG